MAIRIRQLNCKVSVRTKGAKPMLHSESRPERPALAYAMPMPKPQAESEPAPVQTATEERGAAAHTKPVLSPRNVDAKLVADRVYDLMRQEIAIGRQRGEPY